MTGHPVIGCGFAPFRHDALADVHRDRTARVEAAATGRVEWTRYIAGEDRPFAGPIFARVGDGYCRE